MLVWSLPESAEISVNLRLVLPLAMTALGSPESSDRRQDQVSGPVTLATFTCMVAVLIAGFFLALIKHMTLPGGCLQFLIRCPFRPQHQQMELQGRLLRATRGPN